MSMIKPMNSEGYRGLEAYSDNRLMNHIAWWIEFIHNAEDNDEDCGLFAYPDTLEAIAIMNERAA
jgi:hypothetical protein